MLTTRQESRAASYLRKLEPPIVSLIQISGGKPSITASDIAAALAGLPRISVWIVRARYLEDEDAKTLVKDWLLAATIRLAHANGWGAVEHARKKMLALMAYWDLFPPRCDICRGRAHVPDERGLPMPCEACGGRGVLLHDGQTKALIMGLRPQSWRARWAPRLTTIIEAFQAHETEALVRLGWKIGG